MRMRMANSVDADQTAPREKKKKKKKDWRSPYNGTGKD